jgi:hypothetical protein
MRVNLGAGFTDLFTDEGSRIIATFKVSKDGKLGLFYKEDVQSLYVRNQLNMLRGMVTAVNANPTTLLRRIIIDAPTTIYL